jgi:hypothetical protein
MDHLKLLAPYCGVHHDIHKNCVVIPYPLVKQQLQECRNLQVRGIRHPISWFHAVDVSVSSLVTPNTMHGFYEAHPREAMRHWATEDKFVHVHENKEPVPLVLPYLELRYKIHSEQPCRSRGQAMTLNKPKLLLADSTITFRRLAAYIVGQHNLYAMARICIKE